MRIKVKYKNKKLNSEINKMMYPTGGMSTLMASNNDYKVRSSNKAQNFFPALMSFKVASVEF